ncbi:family 43 glycosylhydrolase [Streptomyces sp. NPDC053728]|uniref:family 43 glycosylhydrolase n=1 Tax=Streptomyces sp. NPDC053728 TaxID=3155534 RepID=UPI00342B520B
MVRTGGRPPVRACRRRLRGALLLTLLSALLPALAPGQPTSASAAEGRPYTDPVKAQMGADPWISYHDGNCSLPSPSWTDVITMRKSPTLAGLSTAPSGQVWQGDAASRCCTIWAPELHYAGGRWYLYRQAGGKVADVADCSTADGADVRQWTWLNNACQQFAFVPVS